jgi:GDP-4-dehydro-6-deoxy-D-mannose reductase
LRVLITGATGFVGRHLIKYLLDTLPGVEIHGTTITPEAASSVMQAHRIDLRDEAAVRLLLEQVQPEHIYHLAALASPRRSFDAPWETLENNIRAQLNLILACLQLNIKPRLLVISSAEVYATLDTPLTEDTPFNPTNPYGVSKIAQDMLALQYYQSHHLPILRARPFNHIGPGQGMGFVAPDFATQIARIEAGKQEPILEVGNLAARRDFTDVRDVVRAYHLIAEGGQPGEVYNIASGSARSIQELLDTLLSLSPQKIEVRVNPARFMPIDVPIKQGDASRLYHATGWLPVISFEQTLLDILNECRQRVSTSEMPS